MGVQISASRLHVLAAGSVCTWVYIYCELCPCFSCCEYLYMGARISESSPRFSCRESLCVCARISF